jgi:hypothetical protein
VQVQEHSLRGTKIRFDGMQTTLGSVQVYNNSKGIEEIHSLIASGWSWILRWLVDTEFTEIPPSTVVDIPARR